MVVWVERASSRPPGTPPAGAPQRSAPGRAPGRDRPILVVDDDPEIVAMLRDFLESEGHAVQTAANGAEALDRLSDTSPSVILLDMRMPVLDGWGFAKRLQERQERYPIVVMTAAESAQRWADEIGANGYIAKPFDLDELLQKIERHRTASGN